MNKCSPNNLNRDFSCFSLSELVELTQILNKYTKKNLVLSNNKKELWNNLYKQLEPFCDNEMCWLKQDVFKKLEPELKKKLYDQGFFTYFYGYCSILNISIYQKLFSPLKKFAIKKTFEVYLHPPKKYIQLLI